MKRAEKGLWRYIVLACFFAVACIYYIFTLINLQVSGQDYYSMSVPMYTSTRTVAIKAQRGEIFDRNGKKLVKNIYHYNILLDWQNMPAYQSGKNDTLLSLRDCIKVTDEKGIAEIKNKPFDLSFSEGKIVFGYNEDYFSLAKSSKYKALAEDMHIKEDADADEAGKDFLYRYRITDDEGTLMYDTDDAMFLLEHRLDMELCDFSSVCPYLFAEKVGIDEISAAEERGIEGISVVCEYERDYLYPGYASHILGRIGKIQPDDVEYYTELGYKLDAVVGVSGAEKAFEEYLHGVDGEITITEDEYGNVIGSEVTKEPIPGSDVWLTIDIDLQIVSEDALDFNIEYVRSKAKEDEKYTGEDASSGAITAIDPNTGGVLVMASNPTYDLSTYREDAEYLVKDENSPLLNRAVDGVYEPGSTFKPGVAVAALDSGIITPYTEIQDLGKYEYYEDYQPRCWIYLMYGATHGYVNVTKAIQESCNYFFYEVGRQLTIDNIVKYMSKFGLGQPTGIELPEKTGVLACPEYRDMNGLESWNPGDTLQATIGQYHLFTPTQISSYIATLLNNGTRYGVHLLYKVFPYGSEEPSYVKEREVLDKMELSDEACTVVKYAMKDVIESGSASTVFADFPVSIGGKTGTAQVSKIKSDNAVFTAFAPFDNPEIVATCVIEQGNTGSNPGVTIRKLFDRYFGIENDTKYQEFEDDGE